LVAIKSIYKAIAKGSSSSFVRREIVQEMWTGDHGETKLQVALGNKEVNDWLT